MRTCSKCQEAKPLDQFLKGARCRQCNAEYLRQYRVENKQALNEKQRAKYHAMTPEEQAVENERCRLRYLKHHGAQRERSKRYYEANKATIIAKQTARQSSNREAAAAKMRAWRKANPEKAKCSKVAYYTRMKALPPWADPEAIAEIYRRAKFLRELGIDCHVDHIVPIRGKTVSGLHVEGNLQILLAAENMRKSNKVTV